jgi:hypothetical protein
LNVARPAIAPAAVLDVSEPSDRLAAVVVAVAAPVSAEEAVRLLLAGLPDRRRVPMELPGQRDPLVALRRQVPLVRLPSSLQHQPVRRPSSCHACTSRRRQRAR